MENTIDIKLTCHQALTICTIIHLFDLEKPDAVILKEIDLTIKNQVVDKCTLDEINECFAINAVNCLLGKEPE